MLGVWSEMQGGKRQLGARGARAARLAAAIVVAGVIAAAVIAFAPEHRSSEAAARPSEPTTPASTTTALPARTTPARVAVFGDSLTAQASEALVAIGRAHGLQVSVAAFPGLAPCDLTASVRQAVARGVDALVIDFSGNNITPCTRPGGQELQGAAYFARYRSDIGALLAIASARGVPVELVGPPTFPPELDTPKREQLAVDYARLAFDHRNVTFVSTANALGGSTYATSLPCLPGETAAMGCHDGRIVVRNSSRIHFDDPVAVPCPTAAGRCSYSAGAHRYATAILDGLASFGRLGVRAEPATVGIPLVDATRG